METKYLLNKLIPTRYDGQVELGGSTKPWKVFAIVESEFEDPVEIPYVVKLFSPSTLNQHPCIAKEFICNLLAVEFDLLVPKAGIINLNTPEFLNTLTRKDIKVLQQRFLGETFASALLDGILVNENVKNLYTNIEERAMIYAFDCLVLNVDRWGFRKKSNLLIHNESFMLIDHELSLSFMDGDNKTTLKTILNNIDNNKLIYTYKNHLFYNSLKTYPGNKEILFNTFQEYLTNLNTLKIWDLVSQLHEKKVNVGQADLLFEYIREIKNRSDKFCKILLNTTL